MSYKGEGPHSDDYESFKDKSYFLLYLRIPENCAELW